MSANYDTGYAPPKWEFDGEVTRVFDDMLMRSIPQYNVMRLACHEIALSHVQPGSAVLDLGCALGGALAPIIGHFGDACQYVGVDVSGPMLDGARHRFARQIETGQVRIEDCDLRVSYPDVLASVTLCIFTLQFVPLEYRARVVRNIWQHTKPGGALLLCEKILGATPDLDALFVSRYYDLKRDNGYGDDEIERKRLSLEGVLVPITEAWNVQLLKEAGFSQVDCFWRWMNFCGLIALKSV